MVNSVVVSYDNFEDKNKLITAIENGSINMSLLFNSLKDKVEPASHRNKSVFNFDSPFMLLCYNTIEPYLDRIDKLTEFEFKVVFIACYLGKAFHSVNIMNAITDQFKVTDISNSYNIYKETGVIPGLDIILDIHKSYVDFMERSLKNARISCS